MPPRHFQKTPQGTRRRSTEPPTAGPIARASAKRTHSPAPGGALGAGRGHANDVRGEPPVRAANPRASGTASTEGRTAATACGVIPERTGRPYSSVLGARRRAPCAVALAGRQGAGGGGAVYEVARCGERPSSYQRWPRAFRRGWPVATVRLSALGGIFALQCEVGGGCG
jgi:hypothetical protein